LSNLRVFAISSVIVVAIGSLVSSLAAVSGGGTSVETSRGFSILLLSALTAGALVSLPIVVPSALVAGLLASTLMTDRRSDWSAAKWLATSGLVGSVVGAAFTLLWWFGLLDAGSELKAVLAITMPLGVVAGGLSGLGVGGYCSREARSRFPSDKVQPASSASAGEDST
jgi:hypothetical protein